MKRQKRSLFRELAAGIQEMRDHAEGRILLRTTLVGPSRTRREAADTKRRSRRARRRTEGSLQ
jgi:hypothetical protein